MHWKIKLLAFSASVLLVAAAAAQTGPDTTVLVNTDMAGAPPQMRTGMMTMRLENMDLAPVKGAPFCATVVTEHNQSLSDGNRIHTTDSSQLCRDSEGRTRREAGLNLLGAAPQTSTPKLITIVDPVAGVRYLLDTTNKTAQKMPLHMLDGPGSKGPGAPGIKNEEVMVYRHGGDPGSDVVYNKIEIRKTDDGSGENAPKSESLGDQTIEGIHATGTRMTTTIPVGKMGNEKPIVVTSERWYSPELKATVMTKHDDPWAGELKTEFKNVVAGEPDASLFTVPADYKVMDDKDGRIKIKIEGPPAPPEL